MKVLGWQVSLPLGVQTLSDRVGGHFWFLGQCLASAWQPTARIIKEVKTDLALLGLAVALASPPSISRTAEIDSGSIPKTSAIAPSRVARAGSRAS